MSDRPEETKSLYILTLEELKDGNPGLWFTISLRLGKSHLDLKNYKDLESLLKTLKAHCQLLDGSYNQDKSNLLLEVFSLEIQLCTEIKDKKRLKRIYPQTT